MNWGRGVPRDTLRPRIGTLDQHGEIIRHALGLSIMHVYRTVGLGRSDHGGVGELQLGRGFLERTARYERGDGRETSGDRPGRT